MPPTNFELWRFYNDGLVSPDNFIDWGWYSLIGTCLQRRVWLSATHLPCYPNEYIIAVGDPATGKGLIIKQYDLFLRYHKKPKASDAGYMNNATNEDEKELIKVAIEEEVKRHAKSTRTSDDSIDAPTLFNVAADATSYPALLRRLVNCVSRINYKYFNTTLQKETMGIYTHSSIGFALEELSTLFRRKADEVTNCLLKVYDCGDYDYDTKTPGLRDRVKRCCVSLFAGTTPAFMQESFDDKLINDGFTSRCIFVVGLKARKSAFFVPELTPEQEQARKTLLEHIRKLAFLYGKVSIDRETFDYLEAYQKQYYDSGDRVNSDPKLNSYYGRKNIHIQKLAMALHFGESTEMSISLDTFKKAIAILDEEETRMHLALGFDKGNPLAIPFRNLCKFLQHSGPQTREAIGAKFWGQFPNGLDDLDRVLEYGLAFNKIHEKEFPSMKYPTAKIKKYMYNFGSTQLDETKSSGFFTKPITNNGHTTKETTEET